MERKKKYALIPIIFGLVIYSCITMWNGFVRQSAFSWTFSQNEYWNTVAEMTLVFWLYYSILSFNYKKKIYRNVLITATFLIFCFLHSFFVAVVADACYLLMICLLGRLIWDFQTKKNKDVDLHVFFLFGAAGIILLTAGLSLFSIAYPRIIRWICIFVFIILLFIYKGDLLRLFGVSKEQQLCDSELSEKSWLIVLQTVAFSGITIVACRANLGLDYDSIWYGLRSQYVLVRDGSIFKPIYLTSIVYSYSKGFEILCLPFADLESFSFIFGLNVGICALTLYAAYQIGQEIGLGKKSWIPVAIMAVNPSLIIMGMTAKPDVFNNYLMTVMVLHAILYLRKGNSSYFFLSLAEGVFTYAVKAGTGLVYSTILMAILILITIIRKLRPIWKNIQSVIVPIFAVFIVILRTFLLTGYPFNTLVSMVLKPLGYYPQYPYHFHSARLTTLGDLLTDSDLLWSRIVRLKEIFFAPVSPGMENTMITWWGPLLTCVIIGAFVCVGVHAKEWYLQRKENIVRYYLNISFLTFFCLCLLFMLMLDCPDGNYFMILHFLAAICFAMELGYMKIGLCKFLCYSAIPLFACNFLLMNGISGAWALGATPIQIGNMGYYNHIEKSVLPTMEYHGLSTIFHYFENNQYNQIIYSGDSQVMNLLPVTSDSYRSMIIWEPELIESPESFLEYLMFANIDGILIDKDDDEVNHGILTNVLPLAQEGMVRCKENDGRYVFFEVDPNNTEVDEQTIRLINIELGTDVPHNLEECYRAEGFYHDDWVSPEAGFTVWTGDLGIVELTGYIPFALNKDAQISITVNGSEYGVYDIDDNTFCIQLDVKPNSEQEIRLNCNFSYNADAPDVRQLSFLMISLEGK